MWMKVVSAVLLQFVAQRFGGVWGAAVGGVVIGLIFRQGGAFRAGAVGAAVAAMVLLAVVAERGGNVTALASMIGGNFSLPGWAVLLATVLLPALQSGGMAGLVGRVLHQDGRAIR